MPRILVADDNTNIQKMVSLAFAERGVDVIAVGNGEAAVRRIPDANPDLILADVFMPVRNGYEVCEFVKKDTRFSHVPVILLVGAFDPLDEKEARRVGADGVLKKPFVPPDPLIAMVMSALEKNPKIAAELAKAKEVRVEPEAPPPIALENPAMIEPKPLPEFPEPTPEEAAAIYGFGKGVRSLGDDDEVEQKASKEPKAPVAEAKQEEEEEFDGAATSRDWRRTAGMDLDIPENTAADPAYSYGRDLAPITFPSEKDVPPRRVPVEEIPDEQEEVAHTSSPSRAQDAPLKSAAPPPAPQSITPPVAVEPESEPEPVMGSRARSWMDTISSASPSEHQEGDWMSRTNPDYAATEHAQASPGSVSSAEAPAEASEEEAPVSSTADASEGDAGFFAEEQPQKKSWFTDAVEAVREAVHGITHEEANEPAPGLVHTQATLETHAEESHAEETHPSAHEPEPELGPNKSAAPDFSAGSIFSSPAPIHTYKEPDLEVPPAAHVTPEPLLVNDEASGPSDYGKRPEPTGPIHSFLPPALEPPIAHESGMDEASVGSSSHAFGFSLPAPPPDGFGERIPTAPPPSREALAGIPFLMPPAAESDSGKIAPDQVDAVVQRVIERLEPQLHDLLSKGLLKPLVENLLQSELAKKGK